MYSLGLHRDCLGWKAALVKHTSSGFHIELLRSFAHEENPMELLHPILYKKQLELATALPADQILIRSLELDMRGDRNLLTVLPFQAEDLIPYPKEETLLIPFIEKQVSGGSLVHLVATCRPFLQEHIVQCKKQGVESTHITTTVHALKRWASFVAPLQKDVKILYVSRESSFASLLKNKEVKEFKTFAWDRVGEVRRIKHYFEKENTPWLLAGDLALLGDETPSFINPLSVPEQFQDYAIPLGICFEALCKDKLSVQFCTELFKPPSFRAKRKKRLITSLAIFLLIACLFGPLGSFLLDGHRESLLVRAQALREKLLGEKKSSPFDKIIESLETKVEELRKDARFGSYSPRIGEFLSWISKAPIQEDESEIPHLKTFHYQIDAAKQTSIDMQFGCSSKESARAFKNYLGDFANAKISEWHEDSSNYTLKMVLQ